MRSVRPRWSLIDVAVNLTDAMYDGVYHGHKCHDEDRAAVVQRAAEVGVRGMLLCAGSVREAEEAVALCARHTSPQMHCLSTVGCHPTRANELDGDAEAYVARLDALLTRHSVARGGCVAALGEFGLDYDRLAFSSAAVQRRCFARQLELATRHDLPLYLHNRNTGDDLYTALAQHAAATARPLRGVLHSFTGTHDELQRALAAGLYIGVNGCSLKTTDNLDVVRRIPLDRLLLETDAPWCDVRNTHASRALLQQQHHQHACTTAPGGAVAAGATPSTCLSDALLAPYAARVKTRHAQTHLVKGRCEPCNVVQVLDVVYALRHGEVDSIEQLAATVTRNTLRLFPFRIAADGQVNNNDKVNDEDSGGGGASGTATA